MIFLQVFFRASFVSVRYFILLNFIANASEALNEEQIVVAGGVGGTMRREAKRSSHIPFQMNK